MDLTAARQHHQVRNNSLRRTPLVSSRWRAAGARGEDSASWKQATVSHEGQKVRVIVRDGSQRPAIYVGEGENTSWFKDLEGVEVQVDRVRVLGQVDQLPDLVLAEDRE